MVRAIRGATTVDSNTEEEIVKHTSDLLLEIAKKNNLKEEDIISIFFTATKDINAAFPAIAARRIGWTSTPLMCGEEIDVPGSLKKCIRVLVHAETSLTKDEIKHVYLRDAVSLRPDLTERKKINIAIDGPAGAGKSTIAKMLSKLLKVIYLDTGAMYRAVALKAIRNGINTKSEYDVEQMVKDINIEIKYINNEQRVYLDGEDVSTQIRTPEVSVGASDVAVFPAVRIKMVEIQRQIAMQNDVVMDGRDIGTFVLPDAPFKFFLTASPQERARRRYNEMLEKGQVCKSYEEILEEILYRDKNDSQRAFAPLAKAKDAIEIDSTDMLPEEVAQKMMSYINEKI